MAENPPSGRPIDRRRNTWSEDEGPPLSVVFEALSWRVGDAESAGRPSRVPADSASVLSCLNKIPERSIRCVYEHERIGRGYRIGLQVMHQIDRRDGPRLRQRTRFWNRLDAGPVDLEGGGWLDAGYGQPRNSGAN